jgi:hypothetical protein
MPGRDDDDDDAEGGRRCSAIVYTLPPPCGWLCWREWCECGCDDWPNKPPPKPNWLKSIEPCRDEAAEEAGDESADAALFAADAWFADVVVALAFAAAAAAMTAEKCCGTCTLSSGCT